MGAPEDAVGGGWVVSTDPAGLGAWGGRAALKPHVPQHMKGLVGHSL